MDLTSLFRMMDAKQASDLFLAVGKRPWFRVQGRIEELEGPAAKPDDFQSFFTAHLPAGVFERLQAERDLDLGVSLSKSERFRLNLFYQKGQISMAVRRVPSGALAFPDLHLPPIMQTLAEKPRGLVLITGTTGSGKSTTMAAMLHHINAHFAKHIVTIEDPIEFIHHDLKSVVSQREVGSDTLTFAQALKHVVRQNPDVIFLGEMRDLETMETAISAAMTGHLVVTTLHTVDVSQTLERVINYFPVSVREQLAQDFAMALAGIVSQRLVPRLDGSGLIPVCEILLATPLAKRLIATRDLTGIEEVLKAGAAEGMQTFTRSLVDLCKAGSVTLETAAAAATNREEFILLSQGMETGIDTLRGHETGVDDPGLSIKKLLKPAIRNKASDLILTVDCPPMLRLDGELCELDMPPLTAADTQKLLFSILTPTQRALFEADKEIDFALSISAHFEAQTDALGHYRFRVNGFYQKGSVACALRMIPQRIPDPQELLIPPVVMGLAKRHQGLFLITGPTGHGKSTTLACLIDAINQSRPCHIITVEDPIEFVHARKKAVIEQREVHADTKSFTNALKYVLRQNPDVILIGEMRDQETIAAALTAAETGHLVLATLHTNDTSQTVDRIIDSFPGSQQNQIRAQLASCLLAVVAQRLLPRKDKENGRVAAFEIMLGSTAVRALIRDNRTHQLLSSIETSAKDGMITMDKALLNLYNRNLISRETFKTMALDPNQI